MTQGQLEKETVRQSLKAPVDFFHYQNTGNDKLLNSPMSYRESFQGRDSSIGNRKEEKLDSKNKNIGSIPAYSHTSLFLFFENLNLNIFLKI